MAVDLSEIRIVVSHLQLTAAKHLADATYACVLGASCTILQRRALRVECDKAEVLVSRLETLFSRILPNDSRDAQRTLCTIQYDALIEEHDSVMDQHQTCVKSLKAMDQNNMLLGLDQCRELLKRAITLLAAAKQLQSPK